MITTAGMNWIFDLMTGHSSPGLAYMAFGDSPNAPQLGDERLTNEKHRKAIVNIYKDTGALISEVFVERNEANFPWREVGLIAGGNGSPNTGILVARATINEDKDDTRTASLIWEIKI